MSLLLCVVLVLVGACAKYPVVLEPVVVQEEEAPPPPGPPDELVVILPEPDGSVGALTLMVQGVAQTLDRPLAGAQISAEGRVAVAPYSSAAIATLFEMVLAARPMRPKTFRLYFVVGTDTLTPASARLLPQVLAEVAQAPAPEVMVVGHADRTGQDLANDRLSVRRAERIREELIRRGVAAEAVETVGRGSREATGNAAQDRQVEIVVR